MAKDKVRVVELPIRARRTYEVGGRVTLEETVYCANRDESVAVERCMRCPHGVGRTYHGDAAVMCTHAAARRTPAETPLSAIMTRDVACVAAGLSIETLATLLLEQNISAVPVVDVEGRPVGIASKTDLVRWYHLDQPNGQRSVNDLMMPMTFTLTEDAPIGYAATLMSVEDVHHLPIVSTDGRVVGIVSALDIVRWLAAQEGFVAPGGSP